MLLEAKGRNMRGAVDDIHNVAAVIVEEEGPAILAWAMQNAVRDYQADGHKRFHRLMAPAKAATADYTREDSLYVQWVEECMCIHPEADIDLFDALSAFNEYQKGHNDRSRVKRGEFRRMMLAHFPQLDFSPENKRTSGPHPNRAFIKGLGYPGPTTDPTGNKVTFPDNTKP